MAKVKIENRIWNRAECLPRDELDALQVKRLRETVARVFSDLARQRIVARRKNTLAVMDLALLRDMVEEVRGE